MDLTSIASGLSNGSASPGTLGGSVGLSVLKSIQDLQAVLASELFGSIGIGNVIDAHA